MVIGVTKPYLPDRQRFDQYIDRVYESCWLTNDGQLVRELTQRLEKYLGVENLLLVANGTLALQIAYRTLGLNTSISGVQPEAITTPFSFIATSSSLKWEGIQPVFADIDPNTWCLNPKEIHQVVTERTRAIIPVHVFGNACEVDAIETVAKKYQLKTIYDASHAFGVKLKGESLLKHGDAATLSFHATKLFHTGEGGAIVFKCKEDLVLARKLINFGITGPDSVQELGINAKMNEFQAAMGLAVLDEIEVNLEEREKVWLRYERALKDKVKLQRRPKELDYNFSYFPVVLDSEVKVNRAIALLRESGVIARRYFYPSLEGVGFLDSKCDRPISSCISNRILCLPLYAGLDAMVQKEISDIVRFVVERKF